MEPGPGSACQGGLSSRHDTVSFGCVERRGRGGEREGLERLPHRRLIIGFLMK